MDLTRWVVFSTLGALTGILGFLATRALGQAGLGRRMSALPWGAGLVLATGAMGIESTVYLGATSQVLLQIYVALSAWLVGALSLGVLHLLRSRIWKAAYLAWVLGASGALGVACATTPMDPARMVTAGVISGAPPLDLLLLSTLITGPATVLLLTASALSLRRRPNPAALLIIAGSLVLGAGGTLYLASFPVMLYYSEFFGILMLFVGLLRLPHAHGSATTAPRSAPAAP
jgi:hypothetical protein